MIELCIVVLFDLLLAIVPNFDELLIVPLFIIVADEVIKEVEDDEFEIDEEEDNTSNEKKMNN